MKRSYFFLTVLLSVGFVCTAQTRVSLLEEFTGENCPPCAAYNPALDVLLEKPANAAKMIAIKWQVPIPSATFDPNSLYQTNKPEIDWRYKGVAAGGYGYPAQYSPGSSINDGILNAPTCFINGKNQWAFGATSDHPYYLNSNVINTAASVSTPFSITMATAWNASFSNCVVTVTVSSSSAFTSVGSLMFRLCLVERYIEFQAPTGGNGERKFHDAVRKCYPVTTSGGVITNMGTSLPSTWTSGQMQVLTINCAIPSYIHDKSQMAFVGFVQDDGDRQIYQAARTTEPSIPNDARAEGIVNPLVLCGSSFTPLVAVKNNGSTAITALTITPAFDGISGATIPWSGTIPPSGSATLQLNAIPVATGSHTFAYTISGVSGGDIVTVNNHKELVFFNAAAYFPAPVQENFETAVFPPANWILSNYGAITTFTGSTMAGGYGLSAQSIMYPLYSAPIGGQVELYLPPTNLTGPTNAELRFDLAYQQLDNSKDSLKIFLSQDCGTTWAEIYNNGGTFMTTAGPPAPSTAFLPTASEWTTHIIPLAPYLNSPEVLIKFRLLPDGGNGLFMDNVNLKAGTGTFSGLNKTAVDLSDLEIYPNPANTNATVRINSAYTALVSLELENSLGQMLYSRTGQVVAGTNSIAIDCRDLPEGIYLIRVRAENTCGIRKLVISK